MFSYNIYDEIFEHFSFLKFEKSKVDTSFHFHKVSTLTPYHGILNIQGVRVRVF